MDTKTTTKRFLHTLMCFVLGLLTIIATSGSIAYGCSGEKFYLVVGILNLVNLYPIVKSAITYLKKTR